MKNKELIDSAVKEINDATDWHLISNLTFDLTDSIEKEYLFKEAEKIFIEKECAEEFMSLTRWAINNKLSISEDTLNNLEHELETAISNGSLFLPSFTALEVAFLFQKTTYSDGLGDAIHDDNKVQKWIVLAFNNAQKDSDCIHIIEAVSEEYSGMHLADKAWGMSILEQVKEKVDDKTYKKVVKGTKQLLIG
jgi:hypothetical protein